jgi:DNA-binding NarL/FixJ family response regulator
LPNPNVVFVVDDDPGMLMSVKRLLRTNGYDTMLFSSAKAFKNQVDFEDACCVVLDINLEDGSGIELRYGLKAAGNSVPVIYAPPSRIFIVRHWLMACSRSAPSCLFITLHVCSWHETDMPTLLRNVRS